jgi:hypothetical protein
VFNLKNSVIPRQIQLAGCCRKRDISIMSAVRYANMRSRIDGKKLMASSDEEFENFVRRVASEKDPFRPPTRFADRVAKWQTSVGELYAAIESYLAEQVSRGTVRFTYTDIELNENYIGTYGLQKLLIEIGTQHIRLVPVGTIVIGGRGRVDVIGSVGSSRLILIDEAVRRPEDLIRVKIHPDPEEGSESSPAVAAVEKNYVWKIATSPPAVRFTSLDKGSFLDMLLEVSNA